MAGTKQTPIAMVGNDLHSIEGRPPQRPANQGWFSHMGGKQPWKTLSRKPPCLHTPSTGGIKNIINVGLVW